MHEVRVRVEWEEARGSEVFRILAEKRQETWEFFDRSVWGEVRWYPLSASLTRVAQAEGLARGLESRNTALSAAA